LGLVALQVEVERVVEQVAVELAQLLDVLDAVRPLPLDVLPVGRGDLTPARQPTPVRLDERTVAVGVGLFHVRLPATDEGACNTCSLRTIRRSCFVDNHRQDIFPALADRPEGGPVTRGPGSPIGLHRVVEPVGVLPQAAWRLDPTPEIYDDEVRISVER